MSVKSIPAKTKVFVMGGGPAGSIAATLLARENMEVTLFEKSKFPRYHIGESLLNMYPIFKFIDCHEKVFNSSALIKDDAFFRIIPGQKPGHVNVRARGDAIENTGFHVNRSEFDKLLLDHAIEMGVNVFEQTCVTKINFNQDTPITAEWKNENETGTISFDYLIDATGLSGIISTKYLNNRVYQKTFSNIALGSYWDNCVDYTADDDKTYPGAFAMESLIDGSGWCWAIPLPNQVLSIGVVVHHDSFKKLRLKFDNNDDIYHHLLTLCSDVPLRIQKSKQIEPVRQWKDYSYIAQTFSGPNYRLIGDAAGFIDPLFSSGVYLATLGALSAAASICASIKEEVSEQESGEFHDRLVRLSYSAFILTLASVYPHIQTKHEFVAPKINEEYLDDFFKWIQPLVSGQIGFGDQCSAEEKTRRMLSEFKEIRWVIHNMEGHDPEMAKNLLKKIKEGSYLLKDSMRVGEKYIRFEQGALGIAVSHTKKEEKENDELASACVL